MTKCRTCNDSRYVPAPIDNAWRRYFAQTGRPHQHVLVPCPDCDADGEEGGKK